MSGQPLRVLVVCPSWVGDAVMATPALKLVRERLNGSFIGGLVRPGIDDVLDGLGVFDEMHVEHAAGMMGPKRVAQKLRHRRYEAALLLTNSFSTALIARIAGISRRFGYARDARGMLLTESLLPQRRDGGGWAMVPAVDYFWRAATAFLDRGEGEEKLPSGPLLELAWREDDARVAQRVLEAADVDEGRPFAVLNPGGNKIEKRWPPERFAQVADWLAEQGMAVLVNGSPAEAEIVQAVCAASKGGAVGLPMLAERLDEGARPTLRSLKPLLAKARVLVTNDTGPRHIAVAVGTPVVSLFGPTDHRWTIVPTREDAPEAIVLADPTLGPDESANDFPQRCAIERIEVGRVIEAIERVLGP